MRVQILNQEQCQVFPQPHTLRCGSVRYRRMTTIMRSRTPEALPELLKFHTLECLRSAHQSHGSWSPPRDITGHSRRPSRKSVGCDAWRKNLILSLSVAGPRER